MRIVPTVFLLSIGAVAVVARPARAVFDAAAFSPLKAELESRRDGDFEGTLDKAAKAREKAVLRALELIAKPGDDHVSDASAAQSVFAVLSGPYRAEFDPMAAGPELPGLFEGLIDALRAPVQAEVDALLPRIAGLSGKSKKSVEGKTEKAADALVRADDTMLKLSKRLVLIEAAAKSTRSAKKIADRAGGGGAPGLHALVDGIQFDAFSDSVQSEFYQGDSALQVFGRGPRPGGGSWTVYLIVKGVTAPGHYPLTAGNALGNFQELTPTMQFNSYDLVLGSGAVDVDIIQTSGGKRVKATFSFTGTHTTLGSKVITTGTHDVSGDQVFVFPGNGFL